MNDMKAFYTCSSVSTPAALQRAGATSLQLSYTYEVDTPLIALENGSTTDDGALSDAVDRVRRVTLQRVAERSGLTDCVVPATENINNWRHLELDRDERRRLIPKQRGATSIVGVSLEPGDVVDDYAQCSSDISSTSLSNSFWSEDKTDADETAVTSGSVQDESNSNPPASEIFVNDDALVNARIDGKVGVPASNPLIQTRANTDTNGDSPSSDGTAFNFISTQSEPVSHISFIKDRDPLVPSQLLFSPRMTTKCTVVRGQMTIYTYDSSSYENLQARTIDAIKEDMEDPTLVRQQYVNDVVRGVRFVGANTTGIDKDTSSSTQDPINTSPGYVSSIIGSPYASSNTNDPFSIITFPVMILIALGTLFLVLLALFVGTSNRKRKQYYEESSSGRETYYEEDIEVSITEVRSAEIYDNTNTSDDWMKAKRSDYIDRSPIPDSDDIDRTLSRTFSGLSDRATSGQTGNSVYATYETTMNPDGDIRIQEVRSYVDEENDECYSIHSIFSAGDGHFDVEVDGPASQDSMHDHNHPSSPGPNKKSPIRRLYSTPTRLFSGQGSPKLIFDKISGTKDDEEEGVTAHAYLEEYITLDETAGMEVSLRPFV